jgi:hypothetical protein
MIAPPKDLSKHFQPEPILLSAGISVKGVIPEQAECPFCHADSFVIGADPLSQGGHWLYCENCGFSGDTLELVGKMRKIDDLRKAIDSAIADGLCSLPLQEITPDLVDSYIVNYPLRRQTSNRLWDTLHSNLLDSSPDVVEKLQLEQLWTSRHTLGHVRMARFLGGGSRNEINKMFKAVSGQESTLPDKQNFRTTLAMKFQDAPGRICAFKFIGEHGEEKIKYWTGPLNNMKEGGLAMLETVTLGEGTVFALGNHEMALHLQRKHLANFETPLKLVLFNEHTKLAWQSVLASRVVFWNRDIDWKIFAQARLVQNSEVAIHPALRTQNIYEYVRDLPPNAVLDLMQKNASPWRKAFIKWVTDIDLPEHKARDAVANLMLDTHERKRIVDECPPELQARLSNIMGDVVVVSTATVNSSPVIEQEDGWWVNHIRKGKEKICDAVIKIQYEISDPVTKQTTWQGMIKFKGNIIPFKEKFSVISKHTDQWINSVLAGVGLGTAYISPKWRLYLVNLAQTFSQSKALEARNQIGLNTAGELIFPRFKIIKGRILHEEAPLQSSGMPALDIGPPLDRAVGASDTEFPARSAWMALASAFIAGQLSHMRGESLRPIIAVGSYKSCARAAAAHLAKTAGMRQFQIQDGKKDTIDAIRNRISEHQYPSYVEASAPNMLYNYPPVSKDSVLLVTEQLVATILATGGNAVLVHGMAPREDKFDLPPFDDILLYFIGLQSRNFLVQDNKSLEDAILFDLCNWMAARFKRDESATYSEAKKMLRAAFYAGDALVELFFLLHKNGLVKIEHASFAEEWKRDQNLILKWRRYEIFIDDDAGIVFLPLPVLNKFGVRRNFPSPDFAASTDDLCRRKLLLNENDCSYGWIIKKEHWDEVAQGWGLIKNL